MLLNLFLAILLKFITENTKIKNEEIKQKEEEELKALYLLELERDKQ